MILKQINKYIYLFRTRYMSVCEQGSELGSIRICVNLVIDK